jgi:hypothetical protein
MKHVTLAVLVGTAVLSLAPVASYGQQQQFVSSSNQGYLVDRNGNIVKSARTGQCMRLARQWSSQNATRDCQAALNPTQASSSRGR